jgi:hypothetical protein
VSVVIARFCRRCGVRPVADWPETPGCDLCEGCISRAIVRAVFDPEPFRCPGCNTVQDVPLDALLVCPACGWDEAKES